MQIDCLCNNFTVQDFILNKFTVLLKKKIQNRNKTELEELGKKKKRKKKKDKYRVKVSSPWAGTLLCALLRYTEVC